MNAQYLEQARAAYRAGDFSAASSMFLASKEPGELLGEADHLRGNCLMRLGMYADAASAYADALQDTSYGKQGALLTNQGKALSAAGDLNGAVQAFSAATRDASYATPYKAYLGLGNALLTLGNVTDAGVAFRADAIEAYRTALDYVGPHDDTRSINAGLGESLVADGKIADAIDAFQSATADGLYELTPNQQAAFDNARETVSSQSAIASTQAGEAAFDTGADPLDPLGKSGNFMPDPSDTGFFTLSESEMIQQDKKDMKVRRKHRHTGLKVFLVILIILLLAAGGLGFAYTRGFGFPSQQDAVNGLFQAVTDGSDTAAYLSPSLSDDAKSAIVSSIPSGATVTISAMDQNMTTSTAKVTAQLSKGATIVYQVEFDRSSNHIGWTVKSLSADFGTAGTGGSATGEATVSSDDSNAPDSSTGESSDASTDENQGSSDSTSEQSSDTDSEASSTTDSAQ